MFNFLDDNVEQSLLYQQAMLISCHSFMSGVTAQFTFWGRNLVPSEQSFRVYLIQRPFMGDMNIQINTKELKSKKQTDEYLHNQYIMLKNRDTDLI